MADVSEGRALGSLAPGADSEAREVSLRDLARRAIAAGVSRGGEPQVDPVRFPEALREPGACFVTLRKRGELRGCVGSLEAHMPLVCDVVRNAWRAATADPRFRPVTQQELPELEIHISVLTAPTPFEVGSERELLESLRPGVDGLVLREGARAATFLPAVWESLPEPAEFLDQLRLKAGLPRGYWSETLRFERYTAHDAD